MRLADDVFRTVVASTPLVSIDLVVENSVGEVLLGLRTNRPAKGYWFVPGGRILKNETLDAAFTRLAHEELGLEAHRAGARLLGICEHLYPDSVFGDEPSTHYVVIGYSLCADLDLKSLPKGQHRSYRWWPKAEISSSDQVHANTRAYLQSLR